MMMMMIVIALNFISFLILPDILGIHPHKLKEAVGNIQESNSIENAERVTSSNSDNGTYC